MIIIVMNITEVPHLLWTIVHDAFTGTAATGAFFGVATRTAIREGIKRACFSNEAGLGSAPMAHATAKTNEPIREGVVAGGLRTKARAKVATHGVRGWSGRSPKR